MQENTIAAISTPRAAGGISMIRISGENALGIADMLFKPISRKEKPSEMDGYTCAYGRVFSKDGEELDDCILTVFRAPRSYTGEDAAEISCHGGIFITERVLRAVYDCGAVPAGAGEFTKRAFLNGKLSLTQAEAVMDIISAEGKAFYRRAANVKDGALFKSIKACSDKLLGLLGELDAWVDYPDEDIPEVSPENMNTVLAETLYEIRKISAGYDNTRILKSGIDTVIAGKPNVGKSTLMNLLAGTEKSIVTDIPGTTRDIVEESVRLGDIVLRLSDTAGLRETEDIVEGAGIEKARRRLETADLIIAVFDNSAALNDDDMRLIESCKSLSGVKVIACINKSDKNSVIDKNIIINSFDNVIEISAEMGDGKDLLQDVLYKLFVTDSNIYNDISVNERQKQCLDNAGKCIEEAMTAISSGTTLDAINIILDEAQNYLLELTGERASEAVINEVFSHFCVGK
ncbi:MAG: tRNA uridine-5-carboxymethylaminomethyl(34) synthesis GTPase MnmE [Oscillospiraceae bacterium]|nr:tRNA uridine-5-carboxymethylaminomethyl(34) synthesis GTPase MnmE [Oscillospiraceae bacterium]